MPAKRFIQMFLIVMLVFTSLAATSHAHAWSACGSTYVIQRADWLSRIAQRCGVSLADLRAANQWTYASRYIYPGDLLVIPGGYDDGYDGGGPGGYCGPSYDMYGSYWVVCRGDTLGRIARHYGVSWRHLQDINYLSNPNLIYVGQIIRI